MAQVIYGAPFEGARLPCDRQARLPALHHGDFLHSHRTSWPGPEARDLALSGRHWRRRSSRPVQPFKADPSSGSGGDRASWDEAANLACRRRHPRSATERLRKAPSVSGDGVHHMQIRADVKSGPRVCKVYQQWPAGDRASASLEVGF